MTWIETVSLNDATGRLRALLERVADADGNVDNILLAHGLRPHTLEGHMTLYKHVLHHTSNQVPKWFLEVVGVQVSLLNGCEYCVEHHFAGLQRLLGDAPRAASMRAELEAAPGTGEPDSGSAFCERERAALRYTRRVTQCPQELKAGDIETLRTAGWSDGEILELNQVAAYFAYANRTVLGLGVRADGEVLGLSPSGDEGDDWGHA